jgi:hypothetical protein
MWDEERDDRAEDGTMVCRTLSLLVDGNSNFDKNVVASLRRYPVVIKPDVVMWVYVSSYDRVK